MRYADYDKKISSEKSILIYKQMFEKEIAAKQKELNEFLDRANKRVQWLAECEENKNYSVLGRLDKDGRNKYILLIIRYEDGSQRDERYSYSKILEAKAKLLELREKYSGVDWSNFEVEI